jgi:hypothetical protein
MREPWWNPAKVFNRCVLVLGENEQDEVKDTKVVEGLSWVLTIQQITFLAETLCS